jgi:ABC-type iron transport system FetAB permease component
MDQYEAILAPIADRLYRELEPKVKDIVSRASQAAEPTIRAVIREEVIPKVALFSVVGMIAMGAVASAIGSYFATRR